MKPKQVLPLWVWVDLGVMAPNGISRCVASLLDAIIPKIDYYRKSINILATISPTSLSFLTSLFLSFFIPLPSLSFPLYLSLLLHPLLYLFLQRLSYSFLLCVSIPSHHLSPPLSLREINSWRISSCIEAFQNEFSFLLFHVDRYYCHKRYRRWSPEWREDCEYAFMEVGEILSAHFNLK